MDNPDEIVHEDEFILRAIQSSHIDVKNKRVSSNLMVGPNTSVNRLSILDLKQSYNIFFQGLHNPPRVHFQGSGKVVVKTISDIGVNHELGPIEIFVVADPIDQNSAHAEVRTRTGRKLSKGLSKKIIRELEFYDMYGDCVSDESAIC